ncbi:ABC transporter substrate-binding protein [Paenibacillus radicis (ex Gao et al. 2016)]|uniref:ABC transporter substrate-binding protein n=1 Tax=Paenibacillus radicis (ex Gao et al. 2016) TaxID=1737354 RepID=A0A917HF98_9BACL|nr:ABC transporter substrate-binding protein [Paenibacillus radicis (ex Gao et al. 2016)]GGG77424.1 ABC transporter substrate-binding protein [Paenibacillus radicis (ex Gao et al. 2016)]
MNKMSKKQNWQRTTVIFALCTLLFFLSGCSGAAKPERQPAKAAETKDELLLAVGSEPEGGFDPTAGWGRYGSPMFQSTLLKRNSDMSIGTDLAKQYKLSEDGKQWTVELRDDVKFSDGEPLTASDVKFTFETAGSKGSTIDVTNVEAVTVNGDHEVVFSLKEPQSTFITLLTSLGIVPEHAYGDDYASHPVGSGPYKLVQWDRGQQVIVAYNDLYYGDKPFFKKMTFMFLSEDAAFAAAKSGQLDVAYIPSAFSKQEVNGMHVETAKSVDNRGIMLPYVMPGEKTDQGYPIGNAVTADLSIRQALNYAIDRKALVDGILEGHGTPAFTVNDGLPWWNPDTVFQDGDLAKAAKLLADGGWKDTDGDGIVEKNGVKAQFSLLYPAGDMTRQSLALAAADMAKAAGIQIDAAGKSWDDIGKLMYSNAVMYGFGSQDPIEMYNLYSSKFRGVDYNNSGYYSNAAVDEWMDKALRATKEKDAMDYWKKSQWDGKTGTSVQGDAPWAWLVNIDHLYLVKDGLDIGTQKIHPHGHGWPVTDNIEQWRWVTE